MQNKIQKPLTFIRADKNLEIRLLYPRIPDKNGKITYSYKKPEQIDDGLKTASIYDKNINSEALINLVKEIINQKYGRIESLLILKDNMLIVEEYFYGFNRTQTHNIHSCTKSVTSLLVGMVLDRHKKIHIDQHLFSFFPQYDSLKTEDKAQITLKNVLTMTTGIQDHKGPPEKDRPDDPFRYVLSKSLTTKPGKVFKYSNESTDLLSGVIYSVEGKRADEFAKEHLFGPLGIHKYFWEIEDGIVHCHSDLHLLSRDMAKIGLLVLNDGKWQNNQIVSKEWICESTRPHAKESEFYDYGYLWWHHSKNNLQWWKEPNASSPKEHNLVTALGFGGQYIMIIRDLNLVIVTTASDYDDGHIARSKIPMAIEEVIPIFEESEYKEKE
jgi:CubicO group peptidase (beta-lactamase class C family)